MNHKHDEGRLEGGNNKFPADNDNANKETHLEFLIVNYDSGEIQTNIYSRMDSANDESTHPFSTRMIQLMDWEMAQ